MRIVAGILLALVATAGKAETIAIKPSDNLAEIVERAPVETTFQLEPGLYRMQYARPKTGQKFIGKGEVIFNGSIVLSDWIKVGSYWAAPGPENRRNPLGKCRKETPLCAQPEDLFVGGRVYRRVGTLGELAAGTWYDDGLKIHVFDDPTGKLTELSVLPFAFSGSESGVVLQNIIVEKYASYAQRGAIEFEKARDWKLQNVTARWNHGVGARIGPGAHLSQGSYSNNGQLGLGGGGIGIVIENVEVAHNNYAGYREGWEAGGTKFVRANGLVVRNSCIHNNNGPGLWSDVDNINVEYANNLVFDNTGDGIKHEISYGAKIYGNTVARNGRGKSNWLWGSQILIQNSQDVEVYDNVVEVGSEYGNGISIVNQKRGIGRFGPYGAQNNHVRNNTIVHLGAKGLNGMVADYEREWFANESNNVFNSNTYVVPRDDRPYFVAKDKRRRFAELADLATEKQGKFEIGTRAPMKLECPRRS